MGAGNSLLDHCEWNDTISHGVWTIKSGELPDDTAISLFTPTKSSKANQSLLRSLTKQLKIIRHPSILHFVAASDEECGPCLLTERVVPLGGVLSSLSSLEVCAGLQNVLEGLAFLHDKVGVVHNNVCVASVYVCPDGSWRLGGLEHSCKFAKATPAFLTACKENRDQDSISPEEKKSQVCVEASACCARDAYGLAVMAETLLEKMQDLGDLTKTFELRIQDECLSDDPSRRPKIQSLLQDRLFTSEFLEVESFLRSIALKTEAERRPFFKGLLPKLLKLPEAVLGRRLVPLLLARFVLLDQSAVEYVLPSLITPRTETNGHEGVHQSGQVTPLLTEPLYREHVMPRLVKIMSVRDHHIHRLMLLYFPLYVQLIDKQLLEYDVFPQLLLGLRDSSGQIVALSLHALAEIVPILGRDTVIGGQSKTFFREALPRSAAMEGETNNKTSNVHGVMEKVLLKELAGISKDKVVKEAAALSPDREKKLKEKEKRREEMRKRREERKLARAKVEEAGTVNGTTVPGDVIEPTATPTSDSNTSLPAVETATTPAPTDNVKSDTQRSFMFTDSDSDARNNDSKPKVTILYTDDEHDDWMELDGKKDYSAISDDIERELQDMDGTSRIPEQSADVITSPIVISTHSPHRALKLASKKANKEVKPVSDTAESKNTPGVTGKPLTLNKAKKVTPGGSKAKNKPNDNGFGGAFDIKSIDIKVEKTEDPFDFFAGMAPSIVTQSKTTLGKQEEPMKDITEEITNGGSKLSFDMMAANAEEDGGGWGEEEDW